MPNKIVFNGQAYDSIEAMPPEVRAAYQKVIEMFADANHNGVPDILEGGPSAGGVQMITQVNITVNGKTYADLDEMPPDVRELYQRATHASALTGNPPAISIPDPPDSAGGLRPTPLRFPRAEEPRQAPDPTVRLRFIAILVILIIVFFVAIAAVWLTRSSIFR
jgi:hypothetical protein